MTIIDKVQGAVEKLRNDDTRLNTAEITMLQQAWYNLSLGLVKTEFYIRIAQNPEVKTMLTELRDEFVKPNLEKPQRMIEKTQISVHNLNATNRITTMPQTIPRVFSDEEIVLDTVYSMQAVITGLQAGALAAVRGDVRDYFLNARDAAFDQWRKVGAVAYKTIPQALPPTMSGVR